MCDLCLTPPMLSFKLDLEMVVNLWTILMRKGHYLQTIKQCSANMRWQVKNKNLSYSKLVGNVFFLQRVIPPSDKKGTRKKESESLKSMEKSLLSPRCRVSPADVFSQACCLWKVCEKFICSFVRLIGWLDSLLDGCLVTGPVPDWNIRLS